MINKIYEDLKEIAGTNSVFTDVSMKQHTTFRTGGNADYFVTARSEESLTGLIRYLKKEKLPYYILGNGSNVLLCRKSVWNKEMLCVQLDFGK